MIRLRTTDPEAEAYLAAVRVELGDLSEDERGDLLEDLGLHLAEVAVDDADEEPAGLTSRLGSPARYAAELRAAAGLPARAVVTSAPAPAPVGLFDALSGSHVGRLARAAWRHPWTGEARAFVGQLAPGWWVLRGYLIVALLAWRSPDGVRDFPVPTVAGNLWLGLLAVVFAVATSIAVGRRAKRPAAAALVVAIDVAVALAAAAVLFHAQGRLTHVQIVQTPAARPVELTSPSGPVTNIFPYSREGQPLVDVLLFDQDGRPLRAAFQRWWADGCSRGVEHPSAADGVAVEFAYPVQYVLGSKTQTGSCRAAVARPAVPLPVFPTAPTAPGAGPG